LQASILADLALSTDDNLGARQNKVAIAAAGAIPLLVQLMGPSSTVMLQVYAVNMAMALAMANSENAAQLAVAGAIPFLVQFLDPGDGPPAMMQGAAASTLGRLAVHDEDAVAIVDAGALPLLVQLLKPGPGADVQWRAASTLARLAANSEIAVTIVSAGAIPPLAQLLRSDADDVTTSSAADALEAIRNGIAVNRAAVAAAKSRAAVEQAMEGLGVDSPSDVQTP
jgi:hypothetical protein